MVGLSSPDLSVGAVAEKVSSPNTEGKEQGEKPTRHPSLPTVDEFPDKMKEVAREAYGKAKTLADEIERYAKDGTLVSQARDMQEKIISQIGIPYGHYSTSQELANTIDELQEVVNKSRESLESPDGTLEELAERLTHMQRNITNAERENEAFPTSRQLLIHDVGFNLHVNEGVSKFARERLGNILKSGVLASRKYQIDTQDRSYANTGGRVVIGKDYIEYTEGGEAKRIPRERYTELYKQGHRIAEPEREEYQLFFGSAGKNPDGKGDDRWSPYFTKGVTFVFSKPSLYTKAQFNEPGDVELYDIDYDSSNTDSPGFHIDLTKEPMIIVVDEAIREDFMEFIKGLDSPLWQNKGQDVNTWLQENVMFAPTGSYTNDADKLRKIYKGIEARFFEKNQITIPQGRFLPTGNSSYPRGSTSIYQPSPINI